MELWAELLKVLVAHDWKVCFWDLPAIWPPYSVRIWQFHPPVGRDGLPIRNPMTIFGTPQDEGRVRFIIIALTEGKGFEWEWRE